ncbi:MULTISPECIES: large conductance mechanosensitive channel protein MscL [unclassified Mumia]|uniref:large conductance mechanosensitive channel protein MscL n=1 Tax=unclassified Mumia TaxID=2621872 RepID=UPI002104AC7A|nr:MULTISPECIES: large conductance mechanosensitive channel protein MscL [unclassified Mumia]MDD9349205.1 large conductance mechanosensitive channel protein MscL [Mumia sp.]
MAGMVAGFKEFIMRGNVVDLAVAVVMGTAVTQLVTAFTASFIDPLLAAIGGTDANGLGFQLTGSGKDTFVDVGAFITAVINFLIIAAVLYFLIVLPMNRFRERFAKPSDDAPPPEDVALLRDIRDELRLSREGRNRPSDGPSNRPSGTPDA